jgi:hypothetical protein
MAGRTVANNSSRGDSSYFNFNFMSNATPSFFLVARLRLHLLLLFLIGVVLYFTFVCLYRLSSVVSRDSRRGAPNKLILLRSIEIKCRLPSRLPASDHLPRHSPQTDLTGSQFHIQSRPECHVLHFPSGHMLTSLLLLLSTRPSISSPSRVSQLASRSQLNLEAGSMLLRLLQQLLCLRVEGVEA